MRFTASAKGFAALKLLGAARLSRWATGDFCADFISVNKNIPITARSRFASVPGCVIFAAGC
jgi:hypothetical protein